MQEFFFLCNKKRRMTKSPETGINGEGRDLNLLNNLTIVYCALPDNRPSTISIHSQQPFSLFCLYLEMVFKEMVGTILGSLLSFLGCASYIQKVYILLNF